MSSEASILRYWSAIELFSPITVPPAGRRGIQVADASRRFPWESQPGLRLPPLKDDHVWRHTLYCAPLSLERLRDRLEELLGRDRSSFDQLPLGDTCLFALHVDDTGKPYFKSLVLSSCAWALGRTETHGAAGDEWLMGFEDLRKTWIDGFCRAFEPEDAPGTWKEAERGRSVGIMELLGVIRRTTEAFGLSHFPGEPGVRVKSVQIHRKRAHKVPVPPHINSFYLSDLDRIIEAAEGGRLSGALPHFLSEATPSPEQRIDVRRDPRAVQGRLAPKNFPAGRWPSPGGFPLVYSQQLAVNSAIGDLSGTEGLFAVNGPPGTGKTTLLRDLVAALVVQRAERMAALEDPREAFDAEPMTWKTDRFETKIFPLRESLQGFEMVVASNNNGAVENITEEIPGLASVPEGCREAADYFPGIAEDLLGKDAWALTAAKLGNMANRKDFVRSFWFAAETGLLGRLRQVDRHLPPGAWKEAVEDFRQAMRKERELRAQRQESHDRLLEADDLEQRRLDLENRLQGLEAEAEEARDTEEAASTAVERVSAEEQTAREQRDRHWRHRPVVWEILGSFGRDLWEWVGKGRQLGDAWRRVRHRLDEAASRLETAREGLAAADAALDAGRRDLGEAHSRLTAHREDLRRRAERLASHWPLDTRASEEQRELSAPWSDEEWRQARSDLFLAALRLHKTFLAVNAGKVRSTLSAAVDLLNGKVPARVEPAAARAAWQCLFLVVPVISTTFASVGRLFEHLEEGALGWLLIDEAGQATPGSAIGALWRARRAVIVGDPLQLEPVVTLPLTLQQALRQPFGISEVWLPARGSVQQLADRQAVWGTALTVERDEIWVGAPLRVHRRCDRPMFDISNDVAYGGLMVFGVPPGRPPLALAPSAWLDVRGPADQDTHWIPEEGRVLEGLVRQLLDDGVPAEKIFLISPFRDVVGKLWALRTKLGETDLTTGTIHTAQGKEAQVVVLVLGGHPDRPGAKSWAAQSPNLLNVAASRAQRRFYVIGDHGSWRGHPYFDTAAELLPRVELRPVPETVSPSASDAAFDSTSSPPAPTPNGHRRRKPQVFLSYAKDDREHAARLWHALRERGLEIWWDERNLLPGEEWRPAIQRAIENSDAFLALLSSRAVRKRGHVQVEIRKAVEVAAEFPPDDIFAIPVRLDECEPAHQALRERQWVDLFPSFEQGFDRILATLKSKGLLD